MLALLDAHRAGEVDYSRQIWTMLVFQLWHGIFVTGAIRRRSPSRSTRSGCSGYSEAERIVGFAGSGPAMGAAPCQWKIRMSVSLSTK